MGKILSLFLFLALSATQSASANTFRLHLPSEPGGLDPHKQRSSSASYLIGNLYRNIYRFEDAKGLVPDLGKCQRKNQSLICEIKQEALWSDGRAVTAQDFLKSYERILTPATGAMRADLLFPIKNAEAIYTGKKPMKDLGIKAVNTKTLKFDFENGPGEFEYDLANTILAPIKEGEAAYSGPYKLEQWKKGQHIRLVSNPFYHDKNPHRPAVEFLFIEEDSVALQLYEKNELQFLRRLPTLYIPQFKARKDFHWIPVTRFDYIGFGPELQQDENVRKALTSSLNYPELQKLFSSEGRPGCAGLPDSWYPEKAPCFDYDLSKIPKIDEKKKYTMMFSALGGEDHKRVSEWLQNQWKKNTGLQIQMEIKENKIYLQTLRTAPTALFRKGGAPDRATCYSALQTFSEKSAENFINFKSNIFEKTLAELLAAKTDVQKKKLCLEGTLLLMKEHRLIPLGGIHFSMLIKQSWTGWKLNQLNQLDLSGLQLQP